MNVARIIASAKQIEDSQKALGWLKEYGVQLDGRSEGATVSVVLRFAASCNGAGEAQKTLTAYAHLCLPDLVQTSIRSCENTIAMSVSAIQEEIQ